MRIVLDFDQTIAASSEAIFEIYKEETNNYRCEFNKNHPWDFEGLFEVDYIDRAIELFCEKKFYDVLKPIGNAIEIINLLNNNNEIYIVTNHKAKGIPFKDVWIRKHLPKAKVVYIDSFDKSIVHGDIFVDDKIECLESAKNNFKHIFCFGNYDWNKEWKGKRVQTWNEILDIVDNIKLKENTIKI